MGRVWGQTSCSEVCGRSSVRTDRQMSQPSVFVKWREEGGGRREELAVVKEIGTEVTKTAEMDGGDAELYMKLIQMVMANGHGMEQTLPKKPPKVLRLSGVFPGTGRNTHLCVYYRARCTFAACTRRAAIADYTDADRSRAKLDLCKRRWQRARSIKNAKV